MATLHTQGAGFQSKRQINLPFTIIAFSSAPDMAMPFGTRDAGKDRPVRSLLRVIAQVGKIQSPGYDCRRRRREFVRGKDGSWIPEAYR